MKLQEDSLKSWFIHFVKMLQNKPEEEEVDHSEGVAAQGRAQFCAPPLAGQV